MTKRFQLTAHTTAFEQINPDGIKATASGDTFEECIQHLQLWADVEGADFLDWTITVVDSATNVIPNPFAEEPCTLDDVMAVLRKGNERSEPERMFLRKILNWSEKAQVRLSRTFRGEYSGYSYTAEVFASDKYTSASAFLAWTLVLPFTARKKSCLRNRVSLRFYGTRSERAAKSIRIDEMDAGIWANIYLDSHKQAAA